LYARLGYLPPHRGQIGSGQDRPAGPQASPPPSERDVASEQAVWGRTAGQASPIACAGSGRKGEGMSPTGSVPFLAPTSGPDQRRAAAKPKRPSSRRGDTRGVEMVTRAASLTAGSSCGPPPKQGAERLARYLAQPASEAALRGRRSPPRRQPFEGV
jgi:hypothetical protein